ncbi:MAG: dTDP-4-dehydrorhamnose reductase [Gemmatimonas sp.]
MRVLILGASGQVGKALQHSAPPNANIVAPSSHDANLRDLDGLAALVRNTAPDVVINCAAFTQVDAAETAVDEAFLINATAPQQLAEAADKLNARFLHVSTDYVFNGAGNAPYHINDTVAPLNVYGKSKLAGERAVLDLRTNAAIVRTAWVHSGSGVNFIATAVRALTAHQIMRVVDDQVSTPTRAAHLAQALWTLAARPDVRGLLHFTDAGVASWYDVAQCVLETLTERNATPAGAVVEPVCTTAFPRPAARPAISLLDKHSSWAILGFTPPHWRVGVSESTRELLNA